MIKVYRSMDTDIRIYNKDCYETMIANKICKRSNSAVSQSLYNDRGVVKPRCFQIQSQGS
jgi:hypothetical protein